MNVWWVRVIWVGVDVDVQITAGAVVLTRLKDNYQSGLVWLSLVGG